MRDTDSEIQQAVLRELTWDTHVDEQDIVVEVRRGVVSLGGTVSSYAKRMAAETAAHRVAGVIDVANDITVKRGNAGPSDSELAAAVRRALEWDAFVPDTRIRSTVSQGWVTLEGTVDCWSQRDDAQRVVSHLEGVRGVTDAIEVTPPATLAQDIRRAIEDALQRHAHHDAKHLLVDVDGGRVVVSGVVHSWAERAAVVGAVCGTVGVRNVDDQLRLMPHAH